jgi:hypothetical protein
MLAALSCTNDATFLLGRAELGRVWISPDGEPCSVSLPSLALLAFAFRGGRSVPLCLAFASGVVLPDLLDVLPVCDVLAAVQCELASDGILLKSSAHSTAMRI